MEKKIQVVRKQAFVDTAQAVGMTRNEAFASEGVWTGIVHTAPGMTSGWHHHGEYNSYVYVISGRSRLESGPGGGDVVEAEAGDFLRTRAYDSPRGQPGLRDADGGCLPRRRWRAGLQRGRPRGLIVKLM